MTQINSPTRILPGSTLNFPNRNYGIDAFDRQQQENRAGHQEDRAQEDQDYQNWLRHRERAGEEADVEAVDAYNRDNAPPDTSVPDPNAIIGKSPASSMEASQAMQQPPAPTQQVASLPTAAEAAPPIPAAAPGPLGGVSSAAEPPIPAMAPTANIHTELNRGGQYQQTPRVPPKLTAFDLVPGGDTATGTKPSPIRRVSSAAMPPQPAQEPVFDPVAATDRDPARRPWLSQPQNPPVAPMQQVAMRAEPHTAVDPVGAPPAAAAAPPQSPAMPTGETGKVTSPLSNVSSEPPRGEGLDRQLSKSYAKRGLGSKALDSTRKAIAGAHQNWEERNKRSLEVLEKARSGDIEGAKLLSKQYGDVVDERVLANGKVVDAIDRAIKTGKALGADHDQAWLKKFVTSYMQSGDQQAAIQAAGTPAAPPAKPNTYKTVTVNENGKDVVKPLNTTTGATGASIGNAPTRPINQRQTNEQINFAWMTNPREQGGLGMTREAALQMTQEVKKNPGARQRSIMSAASAMVNASRGDLKLEDAVKDATNAYDAIEKSARGTPEPAAPAPARDPNAPAKVPNPFEQNAPAAPDANAQPQRIHARANDSDEEIYSEDGGQTWYNADDDTRYDEGG